MDGRDLAWSSLDIKVSLSWKLGCFGDEVILPLICIWAVISWYVHSQRHAGADLAIAALSNTSSVSLVHRVRDVLAGRPLLSQVSLDRKAMCKQTREVCVRDNESNKSPGTVLSA